MIYKTISGYFVNLLSNLVIGRGALDKQYNSIIFEPL